MTWTAPAYDPTRELRDHGDQDTWRTGVRLIAQRHGLDTKALAPVPSGSDIVWMAGDAVVKWTAPSWSWQLDAEVRGLALVAGKLRVRTPDLIARGELDGWPYLVLSRVPGVALADVWPGLGPGERLRLARSLGELARDLHDVPVEPEPDRWAKFYARCRESAGQRHDEPGVPTQLLDEIEPWLADFELEGGDAVLLHTELLDQHVFVEPHAAGFRPCGLIDFADARIGPAEYDVPAVVEFVFRGEHGLLRAFLEAHGEPLQRLTREQGETTERRLLAWGLVHRYGRLSRMLAAVAPFRPSSLGDLARRLYGLTSA